MRRAVACAIGALGLLLAGCIQVNPPASAPVAATRDRSAATADTAAAPAPAPPQTAPAPTPTPAPAPAQPSTAAPAVMTAPAVSGKDRIETRHRFLNVKARCDAAVETYTRLQKDSASLGSAPHPDLAAAFHRMRGALQAAESELDRGEVNEARESLDLAETSAAKVLRAGGGN